MNAFIGISEEIEIGVVNEIGGKFSLFWGSMFGIEVLMFGVYIVGPSAQKIGIVSQRTVILKRNYCIAICIFFVYHSVSSRY